MKSKDTRTDAQQPDAGVNEATDTYNKLRQALEVAVKDNYALFGATGDDEYELAVHDIYVDEDALIVRNWRTEKLYRVTYTQGDDDKITLGDPEEVRAEVSYEPVEAMQPPAERTEAVRQPAQNPAPGVVFTELLEVRFDIVEDAGEGKPLRVRGYGLTPDVVNANGRRYPREAVKAAIEELKPKLESDGGVRGRVVTGEAEHPSDKGQRPNLLETVVRWDVIELEDDGPVVLEGVILPTSKGRDLRVLVEAEIPIGISQRARGVSRLVKENGMTVEEVTQFSILAYDFVSDPSDPNGRLDGIIESLKEKRTMDELKELLQSAEFQAALSESVRHQIDEALKVKSEAEREAKLREALGASADDDLLEAARRLATRQVEDRTAAALREQLGLDESADPVAVIAERLQEAEQLRAAAREREIAEFIEAQVAELSYPDSFKDAFKKAVANAGPATIDEAKATIKTKREEYDALVAAARLAARGMDNGVQVVGSVLENETGTPEFARPSFELTESLVNAGLGRPFPFGESPDKLTPGQRYTRRYLEAFDKRYQRNLIAEAQQFEAEEASSVSDLNLPYQVSRTIIAQAFPELIAASVFDVDLAPAADTRVFFELYEDEAGAAGDTNDEAVEITEHGVWYPLAHKRIEFGSVVVTAGANTYVEGDDYLIDYVDGRIMGLATGDIAEKATVTVAYSWVDVRRGEWQPIAEGKQTLSSIPVTLAADRLASRISNETIVFSRAQLGYDAVSRNLAGLIGRVQRKIDAGIFAVALSAALQVAGNVGSWSMTVPPDTEEDKHLKDLIFKVGTARTNIYRRNYMPTAIVMSAATADIVSRSSFWSAAGQRPDQDMNAAGYIGRLAGLPVFMVGGVGQFPDNYILVANRELVAHRTLAAEPMRVRGPYHVQDTETGALLAGEMYYIEEFNASVAPVPGKGSAVRITA